MSVLQPSNRILFIDDDANVRSAFKTRILKMGYEVDLAADGEEACELANRHSYAVVVTDYLMPGLDGLGVIRRLRISQSDTVFLMITGNTNLSLSNECDNANCIAEIIYKPCSADQFKKIIERAFESYSKRITRRHIELVSDGKQDQVFRVLVIEDNPADFDQVKLMLSYSEFERYEVVHAQRIIDALHQLHAERFDAVLVDLSLPDARGFTAVAMVHGAAGDTPVLVLSGQDDEDLERQAVAIGAQDFLIKGRIDSRALNRSIAFAIQRQRSRRRLAHLANYNHLTKLPNRLLFRDRLSQAIARYKRNQKGMALMFIDLDRFKAVNDTYGHDAGDALLVEIAQRLLSCSRGSDTVAHLSGDEFTVIADNLDSDEGAITLARRILKSLERPVVFGKYLLQVTCSIGIAGYSQGMDLDQLIKNADSAMYQAKRKGRNQTFFFHPTQTTGPTQPPTFNRNDSFQNERSKFPEGENWR